MFKNDDLDISQCAKNLYNNVLWLKSNILHLSSLMLQNNFLFKGTVKLLPVLEVEKIAEKTFF